MRHFIISRMTAAFTFVASFYGFGGWFRTFARRGGTAVFAMCLANAATTNHAAGQCLPEQIDKIVAADGAANHNFGFALPAFAQGGHVLRVKGSCSTFHHVRARKVLAAKQRLERLFLKVPGL